jgi:hypothetical protein
MSAVFVYLPWLWLGAVVVGGGLVEFLWAGVVVLRAADVGYDLSKCEARQPKVDLAKALRRRITWPRLGLPLFALCAALFAAQLLWMSVFTYTVISIAWFLGAVPRKMWGIAVARRVMPRPDTRYWQDVRRYYVIGLSLPSRPEDQMWFIGKLRWLNQFQRFWYLLQIFRFWGIFGYAVAALAWPLSSAVAIFYHMESAGFRREYLRPWWRFDRKRGADPAKRKPARQAR